MGSCALIVCGLSAISAKEAMSKNDVTCHFMSMLLRISILPSAIILRMSSPNSPFCIVRRPFANFVRPPFGWMVVSRVFGKQFANIQASLLFSRSSMTSMIFDSTALETNSLFSGTGRLLSYFCAVHGVADATIKVKRIIASFFMLK